MKDILHYYVHWKGTLDGNLLHFTKGRVPWTSLSHVLFNIGASNRTLCCVVWVDKHSVQKMKMIIKNHVSYKIIRLLS